MRLFIIFISILLWLSLWLNQLFYKKINSVIEYNQNEIKVNKKLVINNKKENQKLDNYFSTLSKNISLNYKDYIKQYNEQKKKELEKKLMQKKNECRTIFKDYMNSVVLYPSSDYIRYTFLKEIYNNVQNSFYRKTKQKIKYELWAYGYETYYNVRKYDRNNFISWFVFISNPWKYNIFSLQSIPNIYGDNNYLMKISELYNLNKIDVNKIKWQSPIYTDILFYYTLWDNTNNNKKEIINLVKIYYQVFKKCDKKILDNTWLDLNNLWKKCGYLSYIDLDKLWMSYKSWIHLKTNYMIIDEKIKDKYNICLWFKDDSIKKIIQNNIKLKEKKFFNRIKINFNNKSN